MRGWTLIKLMFTGQDRQALQTLIDNDTITAADQCTPTLALKAIQTALKDREHYWHYRDKVLSNIRQQPEEQVHTLSTRIINLVNNCNFQDQQTTETLKIMHLQHAIKYHKAHNWIRLQDPTTLTYKTLLNHCKQLKQHCKQFKKVQQKGRAELTTIANASVTHTSIHQDAITTHPSHNTCYRCGYNHINRECPAIGQRCHNCNGMNHFTALCKSSCFMQQIIKDTVEEMHHRSRLLSAGVQRGILKNIVKNWIHPALDHFCRKFSDWILLDLTLKRHSIFLHLSISITIHHCYRPFT